ncbi:putative ribonuclease P protein subunit p29 [Triangularia verruculosa]|uniref:Ribonuclease P protein subunit n=1 Tax=Triangularia verruculosa TaxID=2587418 RepID=A0AAN6XSY7_9PEZI|nr:putative ribonuclease P protein subunit p29 [Triangularia verruculosa]
MIVPTEKDHQSIAAELLNRAFEPEEATRILTEKVVQRPLFLCSTSPPPADARRARQLAAKRAKEQRRTKSLKPKPLSATQRKKQGLYQIPKEGQKYALFEPLHNLWLGYIREVLGNEVYTGGEATAAKLASADFHGAELEVVRSGCVSRVGIKGIVVKDGKFAFEIVTVKNKVKVVPKEGTIFRVEVPVPMITQPKETTEGTEGEGKKESKMVFELHGDQFQFRAADRATRKFRAHFSKTL